MFWTCILLEKHSRTVNEIFGTLVFFASRRKTGPRMSKSQKELGGWDKPWEQREHLWEWLGAERERALPVPMVVVDKIPALLMKPLLGDIYCGKGCKEMIVGSSFVNCVGFHRHGGRPNLVSGVLGFCPFLVFYIVQCVHVYMVPNWGSIKTYIFVFASLRRGGSRVFWYTCDDHVDWCLKFIMIVNQENMSIWESSKSFRLECPQKKDW